jgi:hypothetical protein
MQQRCVKRCIGLQLAIAATLVAAIVIAYIIQKVPIGTSVSDNPAAAPFYDGEKYTTADDRSPIGIDINGEETDDRFITSAEKPGTKDDDFITTIELPQLPIDISPRLDLGSNEISLTLNNEPSDIDGTKLRDVLEELPKREQLTNLKRPEQIKREKPSMIPISYRASEVPSDGPSLEPSLLPSDGPSLEPSLLPSNGPSLEPSLLPSDGPSLEPSLLPSDSKSDVPSDGPSVLHSENFGTSFEATTEPTFEPSPNPNTMESLSSPKPSSSFDNLVNDFVEGLLDEAAVSDNDLNCPLTHEYSTPCSDEMIGRECFYDYAYTGCSWDSLRCSPMAECKCESPLFSGEARWSCKENGVESCLLRKRFGQVPSGEACNPEEPLTENKFDGALDSATVEEAELSSNPPSIIPTEVAELFSHSPSTTPIEPVELSGRLSSTNSTNAVELSSECPLDPNFGECSGYQDGLHCDFDFIYTGCTWDMLQCSPAIQCDCSEGLWNCVVDFTEPCEVTVNGHPPGGIPWGEECHPSIPIEIPEKMEKKKQCPETFAFGSCIEYEDDLGCEYNHVYRGCIWDEFSCDPSIRCDCQQDTWECSGNFENPCKLDDGNSALPEGLPWGKACDPMDGDELEVQLRMRSEPATSEPSNAPTPAYLEDDLSNECPMHFRYGECWQEYVDDLQCPYNYAYKGCTWEELSCEPSIECKCDHWFGQWQCKPSFGNCIEGGFSVLPVGLPWGGTCDPTAELPSPPPSTSF